MDDNVLTTQRARLSATMILKRLNRIKIQSLYVKGEKTNTWTSIIWKIIKKKK